MKLLRMAVVVAGLLAAAAAFAGDAKEGLIGIQVTNGTADLYSPSGNYISAYDHPEIGLGLQYWRLMSKDYAFTFSAGIGTFSETDKSSAAGESDFKYTQSSWSFRVGGDRAVKVGERAILYFGPGIEMWSGKAKFEGGPAFATAYETENVTRWGLSGRIGGVMLLSERFGFNCQVGRYLGIASAKENGAEATWWPSGFQASGGLIIRI
jgi:opacity protein-like surface antigen